MKTIKKLFALAAVLVALSPVHAQPQGMMDFSKAAKAGRERRAQVFAIMPARVECVLFAGGSIMEDCEWKELLGNPDILNRGIDGETMDELVGRLPELVRHHPSKVFLEVGAADLSGVPIPVILENLKIVTDAFKKENPRVGIFILSVLPASGKAVPFGSVTVLNDWLRSFNGHLRAFCTGQGIDFVDLYDHFAGKDGFLDPAYGSSPVKLTTTGYALLGECLRPLL